jgi:CheY-like chemotaxis protein
MPPVPKPIDVLLIEDDPGDELITREVFEHNKFKNTLHVARDGQEGLDYLYRRGKHQNAPQPDLILLDLNLPKYDGRQLLERFKSDPDLCHIPIVVLTTSSAEEDPAQLPTARECLRNQTGRPRSIHERGTTDRRILRASRAPSA